MFVLVFASASMLLRVDVNMWTQGITHSNSQTTQPFINKNDKNYQITSNTPCTIIHQLTQATKKKKIATWIINQITSIEIHNIVTKSTLHCLYRNKSKKKKRKKKRRTLKHFHFQIKKKYTYIYDLFFLASQIPNPPTHVLQSRVPLLWTPGGRSLKHFNFQIKKQTWMNERMKFKNIRKWLMRDVLEPRIGGDRSHRSRWWLPRRSIEWDWNVLSLGATAKISSGRPDPARRPVSPPSNCLSNHFPPSFYSQKMIKVIEREREREREREVFLWRLWKRERR